MLTVILTLTSKKKIKIHSLLENCNFVLEDIIEPFDRLKQTRFKEWFVIFSQKPAKSVLAHSH